MGYAWHVVSGGETFAVRPMRAGDATPLERFSASVGGPYRPEDAAAVAAMHRRAARAQATGDRWAPLPVGERSSPEAAHLAFWLAVVGTPPADEIIGTVGLRRVGSAATTAADTVEHSGLSPAQLGAPPPRVGEVRRLRVAPAWRRRGVATALIRALIDWSVRHHLASLVLNTTSAQGPALALYASLGFEEVGRSYLGIYELVWLRLLIRAAAD